MEHFVILAVLFVGIEYCRQCQQMLSVHGMHACDMPVYAMRYLSVAWLAGPVCQRRSCAKGSGPCQVCAAVAHDQRGPLVFVRFHGA